MTENKRFTIEFDGHRYFLVIDEDNERCLARLDTRFDALAWLEIYKLLSEENEQLKSTIAQLIEQNRKNTELLLSDIRILEKALWCDGCANDYGRLKELRKEFMR